MKKIFIVAISSFVFWSCNNTNETSHDHQEAMSHEEEHHHDESTEALQLNHGERWLVNDEMKPFVENGEVLVNNYLSNNQTDYQNLSAQIKEQNQLLIKSCTMDGESHDELHKWLHPHMELIEDLEEARNENEAKVVVLELQKSNELYHQYFQ
ncbi:MAG TPA: hypothetical protein VLZ75_07000 [Chitinophagales bacterium]|nr:hypothetical protein [Chitinophagales bacterium]